MPEMTQDLSPEEASEPSPWEGWLARTLPARRRLDALLSRPDAEAFVPRLPIEEFFYLVKDLGLDDAGELLVLAAPEQIRGAIDIDVWDRDRIVAPRLLAWLRALDHELGTAQVVRALDGLDIEFLALAYLRQARIHDRTLEEEPDENSTLPRYDTPDTFFIVEFDTDSDTAALLERLLDRIYAIDRTFAHRLILEARHGLPTEMEESSYRWRTARMADLGFIEYYEALEVYRYLDPRRARGGPVAEYHPPGRMEESTTLPLALAGPFRKDTFLARALGRLTRPEQVEDLGAWLLALLNRVLAADLIDPGDLDAVYDSSARTRDTLSLGLEYLAEGDEVRGASELLRRPLVEIFRVGFSLTVDLARQARQAREAGCEDPLLDVLLEARPRYAGAFDDPPSEGVRCFASRADVTRVQTWLDRLG